MEKIKEAFTGKSKEERHEERATGHGAASMTPAAPTGAGTYGERGAYGAGGPEYTGGAAGGPAYGAAGGGGGGGQGVGGGAQWRAGRPRSKLAPCPTSGGGFHLPVPAGHWLH